jgi:hypothetical protein
LEYNVFKEGELEQEVVSKDSLLTSQHGHLYQVDIYAIGGARYNQSVPVTMRFQGEFTP